MAKVYINPGHDKDYDSGAVHPVTKMREADVVKKVGDLAADYLTIVGYDVLVRQSDNLYYDTAHEDRNIAVIDEANTWGADVFVTLSIVRHMAPRLYPIQIAVTAISWQATFRLRLLIL